MENKRFPITPEELGIYLSCLEPTLAYNLPLLLPLGKEADFGKAKKAFLDIVAAHPYLNMQLSLDAEGNVTKSIVPCSVELKEEAVESIDRDAIVQPFELIGKPLYRARYFKTPEGGYLFVDFHHVLMDGFSLKKFLDEFAARYEGKEVVVEDGLSALEDAGEKAKRRANSAQFAANKEYFIKNFDGIDTDSTLVEDHKDHEVRYGTKRVAIPNLNDADVAKALKEYGVRRSSFFLGAFALALSQATFLEEAVFLSVNNGRSPATKDSFGMFVKTFPVYVKGTAEGSVGEYLKKVDDQQKETLVHSDYSFSDLVNDISFNAEYLFAYQGDYYYHYGIGGKDVAVEQVPVKDGKEKLAIQFFRDGDGYFADVEYRADLYDEDSVVALLLRTAHFARQLMEKGKLEDIEPCSEEDLALVRSFNADHDLSQYDLKRDFVEELCKVMKKNPKKPAVIAAGKTITYGELDDLSDRIADYLIDKGIGRGDVVSIIIGRNVNMGICPVGVLKSGAAYQPLDPTYPEERLSFMVQDSAAKLVIADRGLETKLADYKGPILYTDEIAALPKRNLPRPESEPGDVYIMLYTSGSTGKPKGVQLMRSNLSIFLQWEKEFFHLTEEDSCFAYASFGFDANMFDTYGALVHGLTLHVIDEEMRLDLKRIAEYIDANGITFGFMTTQVGRQFAEDYDCKSLKHLVVGGEKLVPVAPPKSFSLYNGYGPTECTIMITCARVDKEYYRVPIGPGFPCTHLYVLDKKMRPLPYGVPGYLYCSGPQVGKGYLNRPEENAKAFIENPLEGGAFSRMYSTGDVVRFLKDGVVDFIGRKDGQVKIRGFRIEMSEVERVIRDFPGVKDATVNAYPAASGGSFIAGYVVSDQKLDLDAIKQFILERKPPYMVPEVMMQIDKIPLNQNSKVNKRALPVPQRQEADIVPPEGEKEEKLLAIAQKVLGYKEVSVTVDLFEAGLTSISSIKFMTLASAELGVDITSAILRKASSIRGLAALSGEEEEGPAEILDDYPLTATQQGIYVECLSHPGSTVYNIPLLYELSPKTDVKKLEAAVVAAINAHPYLKSHLKVDASGDPRVVPCLDDPVKVEIVNGAPETPFRLKPHDLMKGPFYQARIYVGEKNYLFLDTHHIGSDGSSLAVLMEDIDHAYKGEEIEKERRDGFQVALKEQRDATPEAKAAQKAHYASFLDGVDCLSLPRKEYELPSEEKPMEFDRVLNLDAAKIQPFLKDNGIGINGFFNAVFAYALAKWDGNEDALFASIYSGRDSSYTARTATMMVKTLPVYAKFEKDTKVLDFVRAVAEQIRKSEESTLYSFAEIAHDFNFKAEVMFAYQGDGFLPDEIGGEKAKLIHLNGDEVKAEFSVDCLLVDGQFKLHYEYPSNLYREETMQNFSSLFAMVAKGFVEKEALRDIVLCDEETAAALDVYNQTDDALAPGTYLDLFADWVKKSPDKPAVIGIDETLTYAEFDRRGNKVANALLKLGVAKDDKIVVMVPRIANAYVAREGVLKSGASFVPVDPAYPDERILYIFEDSEAKAILITRALFEEKSKTYGENAKFLILEDILASESDAPVDVKIDGDALAYCIYTSGSTGKPKGVMIEHHNLANFIYKTPHNQVAIEYADVCSTACSLASLSFDLSIQEEFVPLANGMTVMIASEDEILNPIALAKRMLENGVDIITTTPSYVNNVLDIEDVMAAFRKFKVIDLGAEALPASMIARMRERGMNCLIHNGYGPTEATVACTMDDVVSSRITIGFPLNNVKTYIIDGDLRRLPFGAVGELLIGGEGVARGYIHRDDLNQEKFIHWNGVYAYRSGDLSRLNYDGRIEFFGRKDNQVKLRGLRVELDEIENALQSFPGISHAVVLVKETKEDGQFLVGYYLAKEEFPVADIKAHLAKTLTPYMIPKVFMRLESIPMTNNGKVNKKALPEPVVKKEARGVRLPKNETQQIIYEIFKHVLGVDELSIDDDFFDLGGTSLSASKVTMLAMEKGLPIAYSDVFDNPTVIDLAAHANSSRQASAASEQLEATEEGLERNVVAHVDEITQGLSSFKNILLTGASGFLGIHVLHELLEHATCNILALVRGNEVISGTDRLQSLLEYYFDNPYEHEMGERVHVYENDVTNPNLVADMKGVEFDLIINCAALVKHFSNSDAIEKVNLGGVKNLIEVALDHGCRLVQVSTLSVAGENVDGKFPKEKRIHEYEIFFGQNVDNKYINSKIKAEQAIVEAVVQRGLDGKIVRVGNLMGRARDGEFQVNSGTNNFMASIRAYKKLGAFPVSAADQTIDFSPIDEVAKTIVLLASTPKGFTIFHSANSHEVELGDVIAAMNDYGFPIELVDDATFMARLSDYMKDEERQMDVSSLISYNSSDSSTREYILSDNTFTIKALYRLGYKWPITDAKYLAQSIASLATLGFFE